MGWPDVLPTLISLIALAVSITVAILARRSLGHRTQQAAIKMVMDGVTGKLEEEIANLKAAAVIRLEAEIANLAAVAMHAGTEKATVRLEEEVHKLQRGLDDCVRQRVGLKGEMQVMRNALRVAREEIQLLRNEIANGRKTQG